MEDKRGKTAAKQRPARRVALTGMLFALALALGWLESLVTPLLGLPPGVKIGLANVVVMYALFYLGARQAALLVVLKAGFAALTRGLVAGALSAAGGALSLAVMLLLMLPKKQPSVLIISVAGALAHNLGQLLVVRLWFGPVTLYYAPVLILSGVAMGCLTAVLLRALKPAMGFLVVGRAAAEVPGSGTKDACAANPHPANGERSEQRSRKSG